MKGRPQAQLYKEPLVKFFNRLIKLPRDKNNLFINKINTKTNTIIDSKTGDTWGYLLIGLKTFSIANNNNDYDDVIKRMMLDVSKQKSFEWQGQYADGYADTLESMIYLLKFYEIPKARKWLDSEIGILLSKQHKSGFIEGWYLDGNFARTALMYVDYKTQGVWLEKWRDDLKLGASYQEKSKKLFIHLEGREKWSGVLKFDHKRHQTFWKMPLDYPRLNESIEWYTVDTDKYYNLKYSNGQEFSHIKGEKLINGWPIEIDNNGNLDLILSKENYKIQ